MAHVPHEMESSLAAQTTPGTDCHSWVLSRILRCNLGCKMFIREHLLREGEGELGRGRSQAAMEEALE